MKKKYWIPLLIVLILVAIRIALPYLVTNYINNKLDEIEGYEAQIDGVDLYLYRGAATIDSLEVDKIEDNNTVPFVYIDEIGVSIQWSALINGAFVGEVELRSPTVNFVAPNEDDGEFGTEVDWHKHLQDMALIQINSFRIRNGTIRYLDFASSPQVDLPIYNIELEITNISNAENIEDDLPSHIDMSAVSIGGGQLSFSADAYLLQPIPDVESTMEFEGVNLPDLNKFLNAYAAVDAESGEFNLYSEMIIKDGILEGYVRPILDGLKIVDFEEGEGGPLKFAWESIVGFVTEVFENQREDQFATQVPLSGDLNEVETEVFTTIWNIFRNAFVEAFDKEAGGQIDFEEQ